MYDWTVVAECKTTSAMADLPGGGRVGGLITILIKLDTFYIFLLTLINLPLFTKSLTFVICHTYQYQPYSVLAHMMLRCHLVCSIFLIKDQWRIISSQFNLACILYKWFAFLMHGLKDHLHTECHLTRRIRMHWSLLISCFVLFTWCNTILIFLLLIPI